MSIEDGERDEPQRKRGGPVQFWGEVRAEARKVTWATRNEVTISTIMVMSMAVAAALFFFIVDSVVKLLLSLILPLG